MTSPADPGDPAVPAPAPRWRALALRPEAWRWPLLALCAGLSLATAWSAAGDPYLQFRMGDEGYYDLWAREIADGEWLHPIPFFTSPLFAYWLAALYRLGLDSVGAVLLANAALGVGAAACTWSAARRLAGPWAAVAATALVVLGRTALVHQAMPDKTALVLCLSALALAAAAWAAEAPGWRRWLAAGGAAGLAALAHPLLLVLVPAVAVHAAARDGLRGVPRAAGPYLAGALLAVSPATLHNAVVGGELILVCSNGGHNLYMGNHAANVSGLYVAPAFSGGNIALEELGFHEEAERRHGGPMRVGEVSAYWGREALRDMAAAPGLTAARFLRKLRWALADAEARDTRTYAFYARRLATTRLPRWDFGLPALLGLLGALAGWRDRRLALPIAFLALYTLALGVFFVFGRYRLPLLVPLAVLAGALAVRAGAWLAARRDALRRGDRPARLRPRSVAAAAAVALALAWLVYGPSLPDAETRSFEDHSAHARYLHALGRDEEALAALEEAVLDDPGSQPAVADAALEASSARLRRGDAAGARRLLEAAARARPGDPRLEAALSALAGLPR